MIYYYDQATSVNQEKLDRDIQASGVMSSEAKTNHDGSTWDEDNTGQELAVDFGTYTLTGAEETELDTLVAALTAKPSGDRRWYADSNGDSSTTGDWITKLTRTGTDMPRGRYRLFSMWEIKSVGSDTITEARITIDGTEGGACEAGTIMAGHAPFGYIDLDDGDHTLVIEFRRKSGTGTSWIRRARVEVEYAEGLE